MVEGSPALWFGASGFEILDVVDDGVELVVSVQTTATIVGCSASGTTPKDRRWVTVRDAPSGDRAVRLRWRKRIWSYTDVDCDARTWTEHSALAEPRRVLHPRCRVGVRPVAGLEGTPSSIALDFGVAWSTVWSAVERIGRHRVDNAERVGPVAMVGFDETVMQPAHRRRRRRFVTAVVDVATGPAARRVRGPRCPPTAGLDGRSGAVVVGAGPSRVARPSRGLPLGGGGSDPLTGQASPLSHAAVVVDPFHVVRLANMAVTQCRQRVQQQTLAHRGWKGDPLYDVRKLLLLGAERVDDTGWQRLHPALDAGDPRRRREGLLGGQGEGPDVYLTDDADLAAQRLDVAIAWCSAPESGPELRRLLKMLRRWRNEILAHHRTGASNGPVEATCSSSR